MRFSPLILSIVTVCATAAEPAPVMPLTDVRPGMKGHGRSVFKGGKIESFNFEVLGIQAHVTPGHNIILIRASGASLETTGILQGMSGSPCYVEGKLLGALSTGFPFGKEPIAGITPIEEMLDQLQDIPSKPSIHTPLILPKLAPPKVLKSAMLGDMVPLADILGSPARLPEGGHFLPMPIIGTSLATEARHFWTGVPVSFVDGATLAPTPEAEASPLEPGGMASISLVQGDLNLNGSGTITYVSGNKLLLFGHQLFNLGPVDLPLWSATVAGNVSSYQTSFKLVSPVAPVGALRLDRSSGVAGVLGAEARMVPLRVGINLGGKKTLNYRFDIMDNPVVTPVLVATALTQSLTSNLREAGIQSLSLQGNIKIAGHPAIQIENMVADANASRMATYVGAMLQAVCFNPYERPVIEGISLNVKAEERLDLTFIAGVRLLAARVKRGGVLPVLVTLQNVQGVRETATFNVNVPMNARPGQATLMVGDGLSLIAADPDERAVESTSLGDVVRLLNNAMKNNHIYSLLIQSRPGAGLRGSRIEGVPPTVSSLLGADGDTNQNRLQRQILGRAVLPLEREVKGLVNLNVEIE